MKVWVDLESLGDFRVDTIELRDGFVVLEGLYYDIQDYTGKTARIYIPYFLSPLGDLLTAEDAINIFGSEVINLGWIDWDLFPVNPE